MLSRRSTPPDQPIDPILQAAEGLRRAGADLGKPYKTRHFIYVPSVANAQQVAWLLRRPGRDIEIETSTRKGCWQVIVTQQLVFSPDRVQAVRAELEFAAEACGGEYDRARLDVAATEFAPA